MSLPTPAQLAAVIGDITADAAKVNDLYGWLEPSGYKPPARGNDGTGGSTKGTHSDVSDTLVATAQFRRRLERAAKEVTRARDRLRAAVADLHDAQLLIEPPATPDVAVYPHPSDQGEVARAREAQGRRNARAGSTPWGRQEVTG